MQATTPSDSDSNQHSHVLFYAQSLLVLPFALYTNHGAVLMDVIHCGLKPPFGSPR